MNADADWRFSWTGVQPQSRYPLSQGGDAVGAGKRGTAPSWLSLLAVLGLAALLVAAVSCQAPDASTRRTEPNLDPGFPRPNNFFTQVSYQQVKGTLPTIAGAEYVNDDELCANCHGAYAKSFAENVHRGDSCEGCHGPASRHLETQGREPGLIFSFKTGDPLARRKPACVATKRTIAPRAAAGGARSTRPARSPASIVIAGTTMSRPERRRPRSRVRRPWPSQATRLSVGSRRSRP